MEQVEITINKEKNDIVIKSSEEKKITIFSDNNELKATDTLEFLNYAEQKTYRLKELSDEQKDDKNLLYVYEVFKSIIQKINPPE